MKPKILLADDNLPTRMLYQCFFERQGYPITVFPDGADLIHHCRQKDSRADIVVTDMAMPVRNGGDVVRFLRGHDRWAAVPVIIISAVVGGADITDLLQLPQCLFMAKPVDPLRLASAIRAVTGGATSDETSAAHRRHEVIPVV